MSDSSNPSVRSKRKRTPSALAVQHAEQQAEQLSNRQMRRERDKKYKKDAASATTKQAKTAKTAKPTNKGKTTKDKPSLVAACVVDSNVSNVESDDESYMAKKAKVKPRGQRNSQSKCTAKKNKSVSIDATPTDSVKDLASNSPSPTRPAIDTQRLTQDNPKILVQLFLHMGKGRTKFDGKNIFLLPNSVRCNQNLDYQKAFELDTDGFLIEDFQLDILEQIDEIISSNSNYQLSEDFGAYIFHRGNHAPQKYYNRYEEELNQQLVHPISSNQDWMEAIEQSGMIESEDNALTAKFIWLPLVCSVKPKPKQPKKRAATQSQVESQNQPEPSLNQPSQPDDFEPIDWSSILPFGYDKTLKLCILGPSYEMDNSPNRYQTKEKKITFDDAETYTLEPVYDKRDLEDAESPDDLFDPIHKLSVVEALVKAKAYSLPSYKDESGKTLIGIKSYFFVQGVYSSNEVHNTKSFWEHVKKRWNMAKGPARDEPIELRVSIGAKSEQDEPYTIPDYFYDEDDSQLNLDSDDEAASLTAQAPSERRLTIRPSNVKSPGLLLSQDEQSRKRPPAMANQKRQRDRREEGNVAMEDMNTFFWKIHSRPESPLHHAFTEEHWKKMKEWFSKKKIDNQWIWIRYQCETGKPETWPTVNVLPEFITRPKALMLQSFYGKKIVKGQYPPDDPEIVGSYQSFQLTPDQIEEERARRKQEGLIALAQAVRSSMGGASTGTGASVSTAYTVRFVLEGEGLSHDNGRHFGDVTVQASDSRSLQTLYDDTIVRRRVRRYFDDELAREVSSDEKELVLEYRNHLTDAMYQQFFVKSLSSVAIADIIGSVPRNNNGPVEGSAFPITFYIGAVENDVLAYGSEL